MQRHLLTILFSLNEIMRTRSEGPLNCIIFCAVSCVSEAILFMSGLRRNIVDLNVIRNFFPVPHKFPGLPGEVSNTFKEG